MTDVIVAVDLGRSKCSIRVSSRAQRLERVVGGGPALSDSGGATASLRFLAPVVDAALREWNDDAEMARAAAIGVSAAGASATSGSALQLARDLGRVFGCPVWVVSDALASHAGALEGRAGAVLAAGTGAVALAVSREGVRQVDGWGQHVGDDGSGWWIGRAGVNAAARVADGRGPATRLVRDFEGRFGHLEFDRLMADPQPFRSIASFAADVIAAAESGDVIASGIVDEAASLLAESLLTAAAALPSGIVRRISATGGLLKSPYVTDLLTSKARTLSRGHEGETVWIDPAGGAIDGAEEIAAGKAPLHRGHAAIWPAVDSVETTTG